MAYLVTGATGFIGRRLVERLLANRQGKVYVLVRGSSTGRLDDLIERRQGGARGSGGARGKADPRVLVRGSSTGRLDDLIERWQAVAGESAAKRVQPLIGDLRRPLL